MKFVFGATVSAINFSLPKCILQHYPLEHGDNPALALALRFLNPLDFDMADLPRNISLTDTAEYESQIRFFSAERIKRFYHTFAIALRQAYPDLEVVVRNPDAMDSGSRQFVKGLGLIADPVPIATVYTPEAPRDATYYRPSKREQEIERICTQRGKLSSNDLETLLRGAETYLGVGDSYTSLNLFERALLERVDSRQLSGIGLSSLLLGRPLEAEYWYDKWAGLSSLDRARANYAKSMLYARHHPQPLRSIEEAGRLLNEANELFAGMTEKDNPKLVFEQVFNRNGYALIEFRRGNVDEALELVSEGIERLDNYVGSEHLHRTVLMYNRAQCYAQLKDWPAAIQEYSDLIALDPYMPEYHSELARCLVYTEQFTQAIAELESSVGLDSAIPETAAVMAFCYLSLDDYERACYWYDVAYHGANDTEALVFDYAYTLGLAGRWADSADVLESHLRKFGHAKVTSDFYSLLAEAHLHLSSPRAALEVLKEGLMWLPDDDGLQANARQIDELLDTSNTKRVESAS